MKDELPSNFNKQQSGDATGDNEGKDDATSTKETKEGEDTPSAEGLVKTAAAAALVSAAVKAKVGIVVCVRVAIPTRPTFLVAPSNS